MPDNAADSTRTEEGSRSARWLYLIFSSVWGTICLAILVSERASFQKDKEWETLGVALFCLAVAFHEWQILSRGSNRVGFKVNDIIRLTWMALFVGAGLIYAGLWIRDLLRFTHRVISGH